MIWQRRLSGALYIIICLAAALACVQAKAAPSLTVAHAVGYGAATAGGTASCHFADEATLRTCLLRGGALVVADVAVKIDPEKRRFFIAANTTLDGKGLLVITPSWFGLDIEQPNVIVRNVIFHGTGRNASILTNFPNARCATPTLAKELFGCMVGIRVGGRAKNIWIDHNSFSDCGNACISIWDSNDGTGHPDEITVSNNIFRNSFFAAGAGTAGTAGTLPAPGHITFYGNLFDHIFRRQPRIVRGYDAHIFNNYYTGPVCRGLGPGLGVGPGFGPSVEEGGEILLENNVADPQSCASHIDNSDFVPAPGTGVPRGHGKINAVGNLGFVSDSDTGKHRVIGVRPDRDVLGFRPTYAYSLLPAHTVKAAVLGNAGVKVR